jgi:hypothetical protein
MIRVAKFSDTPHIMRLLRNVHAKSKYAKITALNDKALEQTVMSMIAGQNQQGPQASHVTICEHGGQVVGFMASSLNRVYNICDKLVASDTFLVSESKRTVDTVQMIDAFVAWAQSNPKVIEIALTWSNAVAGGHRLGTVFRRRGYKLAGEQYEVPLGVAQAKAEAA